MYYIGLALLILFIFFVVILIPFINIAIELRYDHKWNEFIENNKINKDSEL